MALEKIFLLFLVRKQPCYFFNSVVFIEKLFNNKSTESIETLADIVSSSSNVTLSEQTVEKIPDTIFVDLSNIGIWIDPVDGTQQYINGTDGITDSYTGIIKDGLPTVLVLIGCFDVHNGHAVIGCGLIEYLMKKSMS